jgi:hypothetical protein
VFFEVAEAAASHGDNGEADAFERVIAALAAGPAQLAITHPAYLEVTELRDSTRAELADDLRG